MSRILFPSCFIVFLLAMAAPVVGQAPIVNPPKLFIDPGHGGATATKYGNDGDGFGALGMNVSLSEQWINLQVALALRDSLVAMGFGFEFQLSRSDETSVFTLLDRVVDAEGFGAKQFISIHHNGFGAGAGQGTEVWWSDRDSTTNLSPNVPRDTDSPLAKKVYYSLLTGMNNSLAAAPGTYADRCRAKNQGNPMQGCKTDSIFVLRNTTMISVLTEASDISAHGDEESRFDNGTAHIAAEAKGLFRGFLSYITGQGFGRVDYDFVGRPSMGSDTLITVGVGNPPIELIRDFQVPYERTWDLFDNPTTKTLDALQSFGLD